MKDLQELSFQATSEQDSGLDPREDYVLSATMYKFISSWPRSLTSFTLDTCGSNIAPTNGDEIHLCALLAARLDSFQNVRLRMRRICPAIFPKPQTQPFEGSKLRMMIIKLTLPYFQPDNSETFDGRKEYDVVLCDCALPPSTSDPQRGNERPIHAAISLAASRFASSRPNLEMLRISYREPGGSGINVIAADYLSGRHYIDPNEIFIYEDEGAEWEDWEEDDERLKPIHLNR